MARRFDESILAPDPTTGMQPIIQDDTGFLAQQVQSDAAMKSRVEAEAARRAAARVASDSAMAEQRLSRRLGRISDPAERKAFAERFNANREAAGRGAIDLAKFGLAEKSKDGRTVLPGQADRPPTLDPSKVDRDSFVKDAEAGDIGRILDLAEQVGDTETIRRIKEIDSAIGNLDASFSSDQADQARDALLKERAEVAWRFGQSGSYAKAMESARFDPTRPPQTFEIPGSSGLYYWDEDRRLQRLDPAEQPEEPPTPDKIITQEVETPTGRKVKLPFIQTGQGGLRPVNVPRVDEAFFDPSLGPAGAVGTRDVTTGDVDARFLTPQRPPQQRPTGPSQASVARDVMAIMGDPAMVNQRLQAMGADPMRPTPEQIAEVRRQVIMEVVDTHRQVAEAMGAVQPRTDPASPQGAAPVPSQQSDSGFEVIDAMGQKVGIYTDANGQDVFKPIMPGGDGEDRIIVSQAEVDFVPPGVPFVVLETGEEGQN